MQVGYTRLILPLAPEQSLGYDVGNAVAGLFTWVRLKNGDVGLIDLESIRIRKELDPVRITVTADYDGVI